MAGPTVRTSTRPRQLTMTEAVSLMENRCQEVLNENRSWKDNPSYRPVIEAVSSNNPLLANRARATLLAMAAQARFMEQVSQNKQLEAVFTQSLGALVPKVIDLVRIFYPNMVTPDLLDIQPIDRMNGEVFTIKPIYSNTAATVTAGQQVFLTPTDGTYASEQMTLSLGTGNGTLVTFTGTYPILPVRPGSVNVQVNGAIAATDNGQGTLVGVGVTGTINYTTGAISATFTTAPVSGAVITGQANYDSEQSPDNIRQVEILLNSIPVQAQPHPLRVRWSEQSALAASAHLGLDIPDTLANLAASFIKQERDLLVINHIIANATPDTNLNFDATPSTTYSRLAKYAEIELKLNYAESLIQRNLGRGGVSWVLAGTDCVDIFRNANGFVPEPIIAPIGPHKVGTLRDGTVAVIKNPFMNKDTFILGFKGYVLGDAPTILAEWIPLYATPVFQAPDLNNYQGLMSMYALVDNNVSYYVKGVVSNYSA